MKSKITALLLFPLFLPFCLFAQQPETCMTGAFQESNILDPAPKMEVVTLCPDCYEAAATGKTEIILQLKQGADPQQVIKEIKAEFEVDLKVGEALAPKFGIYGLAQHTGLETMM